MNSIARWFKFALWRLGAALGVGSGFPDWRRRGRFVGTCSIVWNGPKRYHYIPDEQNPLRFMRGTHPDEFKPSGEMYFPGEMDTDGGSVTDVAALVGLTPFTYLPAFIVHDWLFELHHVEGTGDRDESNRILLEAMYTLMKDGLTPINDFHLRLAWDGVMSPVGQDAWERGWKV